jgi:hypothetical protein
VDGPRSAAPSAIANTVGALRAAAENSPELDPMGSLVDADCSAYYNWLNQQRLPGAEQSSSGFVVDRSHCPAVPNQTNSPTSTNS